MKKLLAGFVVCLFWTFQAQAAEPIIIPVVTDPSPVIDGNLQEWANRGVLRELNTPEQATFNRKGWKGLKDLSGWVRFGYDNQNLFVVCHVVDSFFLQDQSGSEAWRGDHVMLTLDFVRSGKIQDVMQFGLSPGSLKAPGAPGPDTKPELVIWEPANLSIAGAVVAARRTPEGYDLEAAIPWKVFRIKPVKFQTLAIQLAFSDCDTTPARQEKAISISAEKWRARDPKRLTPVGLADRAGDFPVDAFQKATELARLVTLKHRKTRELVLNVERIPEGRIPTLTFKARVQTRRAGGCCGPLATSVNGKGITRKNIANRPLVMTFISGGKQTCWYGAGVTLWYGPSFEAIEKSAYKPLDVVSYDYVLRLDNMIRKGKNTIAFRNADRRPEIKIVMADVAFSWSPPSRFQPPKRWQPAPTGPIPMLEPWKRHKADYKVTPLRGGGLKVAWAGRELVFESRFSKPGGGWGALKAQTSPGWKPIELRFKTRPNERVVVAARMDDLRLIRTFIRYDECILVRDILTNTSKKDLRPLMIAHRAVPGKYDELWLGGRTIPMKTGASSVPPNPSVVVLGKKSGFGIMAHDDVFRIHCRGSCDGKFAELADNSLVLRPGVTYRHEWLIFPLPKPDYWRFVNAARRYFKTNFTIPGSFTFFGLHKVDLPLLPWEIDRYLERKNAYLTSVSLGVRYKGLFPHGPAKRTLDPAKAVATNKTIKALRPGTKLLSYFNCFDCARRKDDPVRWPKCRILLPDGRQVHNGATYPLYFPTLTNAYGREMDANIEWLLNTVGADGIYWDCYNYSNVTHYADPWDGWTGDIHPTSHKLTRKRSSTSLLSWPWREKTTARLLSEGRPIVANGNPCLTSEYKYQFPRFVETADISALSKTHLFTPIALGDHITERNEVDSYRWMLRALDWGGLYYWYSGRIIPTHNTLTTYMFPITPIELHSGYIIAEERILTKVSGLFGWGDMSEFEAHVFNRVGKETDEIKVKRVVKNGRAYAEARIPEGYSAAIVRK